MHPQNGSILLRKLRIAPAGAREDGRLTVLRNRESVRILLENSSSRNGHGKVVTVFSGHFHKDYYNLINGIHYVQINSSTYRWWGESINNDSFGPAAEKAHPAIKYMTFYKDPLRSTRRDMAAHRATCEAKTDTFSPA